MVLEENPNFVSPKVEAELERLDEELWNKAHPVVQKMVSKALDTHGERALFLGMVDQHLIGNSHLMYFKRICRSVISIFEESRSLRQQFPYFEITIVVDPDGEEPQSVIVTDEEICVSLEKEMLPGSLENYDWAGDYDRELVTVIIE